jgi:chromosome partitioning protein
MGRYATGEDSRRGAAQGPRLTRLLEQARENDADLVIIDTPGNAPDLGDLAAAQADAILIPCRPDGPDLISIAVSVRRMKATGKPVFVVINAAPPQGPETAEAIATISAAGVEVCPVVLHQRKPFKQRFHEGLAAPDFDPKGKAAAEIRALLLWFCDKVVMLPREQVTEIEKQLA